MQQAEWFSLHSSKFKTVIFIMSQNVISTSVNTLTMIAPATQPLVDANQQITDRQAYVADMRRRAGEYLSAGFAVIPLRPFDKIPSQEGWTKKPMPTTQDLDRWFIPQLPTTENMLGTNPTGIGIRCGAISGNLLVIDFDEHADQCFPQWRAQVEAKYPGIFGSLLVVKTGRDPVGYHVYLRTSEALSTKLLAAIKKTENGQPVVDARGNPAYTKLIETRGEGAQVVAPGSMPVHPTGKVYVSEGPIALPQIPLDVAKDLLTIAELFDHRTAHEKQAAERFVQGPGYMGPHRPGDVYNLLTDPSEILEAAGWTYAGGHNWTRPGKTSGTSATLGYQKGAINADGAKLFYCFSTDPEIAPLESGKHYNAFQLLAALQYNGNFSEAAKHVSKVAAADIEAAREEYYVKVSADVVTPKITKRAPTKKAIEKINEVLMDARRHAAANQPFDCRQPLVEIAVEYGISNANLLPLANSVFQTEAEIEAIRPQAEAAYKVATAKASSLFASDIRLDLEEITPESVARRFLEETSYNGIRTFVYWENRWYSWDGAVYQPMDDTTMLHYVTHWLQDKYSNIVKVEQIIKNIAGMVFDRKPTGLVCWLTPNSLDPTRLVVTNTKTIDLDTGNAIDNTPDLFTLVSTDCVYDPKAECPIWEEKLAEWLPDQKTREALQEWFGYCLSQDTSQHKMMALIGVSRGGKGTIHRTLMKLLGGEKTVAATDTLTLVNSFGKENMLGKTLTVFADEQMGTLSKPQTAILIQTIKNITGCDPVAINRKGIPVLSVKLPTRLMFVSNEVPDFQDHTSVLASRMLVIRFRNSFEHRIDTQLGEKLAGELAGILNWAMRGYIRLRFLKRFTESVEMKAANREVALATDNVLAFLGDCCEAVDTTNKTQADIIEESAYTQDLFNEYRGYLDAQGMTGKMLRSKFKEKLEGWGFFTVDKVGHFRKAKSVGIKLRREL